jgi:anti-anti-sigma factor
VTAQPELRWGEGTPRVAHLSGQIDIASAAELFAAVRAGVDGSGVVELTDVSFVDSSALNQLVLLHNDIDLRIVAAPGTPARRLLELTGLAQVFRIDGALDAAVADQ